MMKLTAAIALLFSFLCAKSYADACGASGVAETGKVLRTFETRMAKTNAKSNEARLIIKAKATGSSWQKKDSEAAVLTVFLDGQYNQDLIMFAGDHDFEYSSPIGPLDFSKKHSVTIVLNQKQSATHIGEVIIRSASVTSLSEEKVPSNTSFDARASEIARANSPIIYARPDTIGRFSDIPLLTYFEVFPEGSNNLRIRYTTIFTNEDGGTNSRALLARWGRLTDIEWVYEMEVDGKGNRVSEIIQGADHRTQEFKGARLGQHPLILDSTVNNNFADTGCSAMRISPQLVAANLTAGSRETVMDAFPWTYRIMAEEAYREGKIRPAAMGSDAVDDPRKYFYVEVRSDLLGSAISVQVTANDEKTSTSDWGISQLRVDRGGYVRIAVHQPSEPGTWPPRAARINCFAKESSSPGTCRDLSVIKLITLDENFRPVETTLTSDPRAISAGASTTFYVTR